jgi:hypothetical protein
VGLSVPGGGEVGAVVSGSLSVYVSVDRVRDGSVGAACLVLVDNGVAFAVVPYPGHQVSQARVAGHCECVADMSQVDATPPWSARMPGSPKIRLEKAQ